MLNTDLIRLNLHIGDYLRRTRHMTAWEHGAFLMLIMHYWSTGGLPQEDAQLAIVAGMTMKEWQKRKEIIAALFEPDWKLPWLEADISDALEARARKSAAGKKGNSVRWGDNRHANSDRLAFGRRSHRDPNAIAPGSLPLAARRMEESDQEDNSFSGAGNDSSASEVIPFEPRRQ
ncbi:MAG: DUF1376 domain-containing protein [Pseudolabrys sp.]|nr:DUF1376 domain-containing protein [Pseudolabrys sp.]MDP2298311.1 DUF1376 domain-containing protein [Pseudolabrys sp.]